MAEMLKNLLFLHAFCASAVGGDALRECEGMYEERSSNCVGTHWANACAACGEQ